MESELLPTSTSSTELFPVHVYVPISLGTAETICSTEVTLPRVLPTASTAVSTCSNLVATPQTVHWMPGVGRPVEVQEILTESVSLMVTIVGPSAVVLGATGGARQVCLTSHAYIRKCGSTSYVGF